MDEKYLNRLEEIFDKVDPEVITYTYDGGLCAEIFSFTYNTNVYAIKKYPNGVYVFITTNTKKQIFIEAYKSLYTTMLDKYNKFKQEQLIKNLEEWYNNG